MVTEPVAVTTFPMGLVSMPSARAALGATTLADSITPATNTAIAWARIGSICCLHSLRAKLSINTPAPLEQQRFRDPRTVPNIADIAKLPSYLGLKKPQSTA